MFINARPRIVSSGYETFVPAPRVELLHQRLMEMTNSDVNAWIAPRPVASFSTDAWEPQLDGFGNEENLSQQSLYTGYYPGTTPTFQNHPVGLPRVSSYTVANQSQCHPRDRFQTAHQSYEQRDMNWNGEQGPMLGDDYSPYFGHRNGSFAEFSSSKNALKGYSCPPPMEADLAPYESNHQKHQAQQPFQGIALASNNCYNLGTNGNHSDFGNYSSTSTEAPLPQLCSKASKDTWWIDTSNNKHEYQSHNTTTHSQDGLPRSTATQQQSTQGRDLWNMDIDSANSWNAVQAVVPDTISPTALSLNLPSASMSSSGSSQGSRSFLSDSSSGNSSGDDQSNASGAENFATNRSSIQRPRQTLPDSLPESRRVMSVSSSNGFLRTKTTRRRPLKSVSTTTCPRYRGGSSLDSSKPDQITQSIAPSARGGIEQPRRIEPKPSNKAASPSWSESPRSSETLQVMDHRDAKDNFLVRSKLAGMSYKQIREEGQFAEAESTLRGRFRTLTKHKTARVRKPEWNDNDIRLLKKAVRKLATASEIAKSRVPWKQVAEYIANHGGSYHFGNATCRKRWDECQSSSEAWDK